MRRTTGADHIGNLFQDENLPGTPGTLLEEVWKNDLQESIIKLIEDQGIPISTDAALTRVRQMSQAVQIAAARATAANFSLATEGSSNWLDTIYDDASGLFIVVGGDGAVTPAIVSGDNGTSWASGTGVGGSADITAIASNPAGPLLVAVAGSAQGYTSVNGTAWTQRVVGAASMRGVAFGSAIFLATGTHAVNHYSSADGITWAAQAKATSVAYNGVASDGTMFVAVGDAGNIETSTNGTATWVASTSGTAKNLQSIDYAANGGGEGIGMWVACGDTGALLWSYDAITWNTISSWQGGLTDCTVVRHLGDRVGWIIGGDNGQLFHGHVNKMLSANPHGDFGTNSTRGFACPAKGTLNRTGRIVMATDTTGINYSERI